MLSKKALLEKLIGKKVQIYTLNPITIHDVPPNGDIHHIITEVGSDVFAYETFPPQGNSKIQYISISAVARICTKHV